MLLTMKFMVVLLFSTTRKWWIRFLSKKWYNNYSELYQKCTFSDFILSYIADILISMIHKCVQDCLWIRSCHAASLQFKLSSFFPKNCCSYNHLWFLYICQVDGTEKIEDKYWNPGPRRNPPWDTKYTTYGFAYLQDMVEQSLIGMMSNDTTPVWSTYISHYSTSNNSSTMV